MSNNKKPCPDCKDDVFVKLKKYIQGRYPATEVFTFGPKQYYKAWTKDGEMLRLAFRLFSASKKEIERLQAENKRLEHDNKRLNNENRSI